MTDTKRAKLGGAFARGGGASAFAPSNNNNSNAPLPSASAAALAAPRPRVLSHDIVDTFNVPGERNEGVISEAEGER